MLRRVPPPDDIARVKLNAGRRIAELRTAAGLSQTEVAKRMKASQQFVWNIEQGDQNLTLDTLVRVANAIGVRTHELLLDDARATPPPPRATKRTTPSRARPSKRAT